MPRVLSEICNQILIPFESIDNVLMAEIQLIIQYFPIKLSYQIAHFYVTCLHLPFHWWRIHFECFVAIINWITMQCICFYEHGEWCVDVCGGHKPCRGHKSNKMTIWHFTIDQIRGDWTTILSKWNQFTAVITSIMHWLSYNAQGEAHLFAHFTNSLNA